MAEVDSNFAINPGGLFNRPDFQRANLEQEEEDSNRIREDEEDRNSARPSPETADNRPDAQGQARRLAEDQVRRGEEPALEPPQQFEDERPLENQPEQSAGQGINLPFSREVVNNTFEELRDRPEGDDFTNTQELDENSAALRPDNLGTDPSLRANRDLRNLLDTEPEDQPAEDEGQNQGPLGGAQNIPDPAGTAQSNTTAPGDLERVGATENEPNAAQARAAEREEEFREEEDPHSSPDAPEAVQTQRGQNINQLI
jgi:hypothetical protein